MNGGPATTTLARTVRTNPAALPVAVTVTTGRLFSMRAAYCPLAPIVPLTVPLLWQSARSDAIAVFRPAWAA